MASCTAPKSKGVGSETAKELSPARPVMDSWSAMLAADLEKSVVKDKRLLRPRTNAANTLRDLDRRPYREISKIRIARAGSKVITSESSAPVKV